ncbi:arylsulfatase [Runella salmonicolor]|uniref:Arylsulfatase n=1 Tax=Runella salmonicolor TaxID=2950278 RepID=A0ABT1FMR5_9BACT|nr:arylsulfatase [Runella salmonicolor]MCP1382805.1 arylsulfatase [Runella salmonicolor]
MKTKYRFTVASLVFLGLSGLSFGPPTATVKPNIIVIMADDMGFSDIGCYGSEIPTPHLDNLAKNGTKFTQFYNAARCCPSRAALLTGVYPHQAGMGEMVVTKVKDRAQENPYQGWLSRQTATVAEVLKTAGYQTFMSGKWHVGEERVDWPLQRGFDKYFGLISGATSYYEVLPGRLMLEDNEPYNPPKDFYMTDAISDKAVEYISSNEKTKQPFFMYVAYTAPHWPLHAPDEEIQKFRGKYKRGWDELRKERFLNQQKMGLFGKKYALPERDVDIAAWENTTNQDEWDLKMATYAAMVSRMDAGIGKIVEKLRANGQLNNTMIVFLSDNGACAEVLDARAKKDLGEAAYAISLTTPAGQKGSYTTYSKEWAALGNTPFRMYKQFTHEGGIATPMIVHYPNVIKKPFQTSQVGHIIDLLPTILEVAQVKQPLTMNQQSLKPIEGKSLMPILQGKTRKGHDYIAWEHFDNRAIRQGKWKLVGMKGKSQWELYDIENDRTETQDLAQAHPEIVAQLTEKYRQWAEKVGVRK